MGNSKPARLALSENYRSANLWMEALRNLRHSPSALLGSAVIGALVIIAVFAPFFATHDPIQTMIGVPGETGRLPSKPPCIPILGCEEPQHILGLDLNARDLYSRVIYGTRTSLSVGVITISLSIIVGTALGISAGYMGGRVDNVIMRLMDVVLAFPALLLAISIVTILGPGLTNALLGITITFIPQYARLSRASVLSIKEQEFVVAEQALGASPLRIVLAHILPNAITPISFRVRSAWARRFLMRPRYHFSAWARSRRRRNGGRSSANRAIICLRHPTWYSSPASRS